MQKQTLLLKFITLALIITVACSVVAPSPQLDGIEGMLRVESHSMRPTIPTGAVALVDEDAYTEKFPARGDIIVFDHPLNPDVVLIKRIIGLPNEQIEIKNDQILIGGNRLDEPYSPSIPNYVGDWFLGDNEYFVLSDVRELGSDSHLWGAVPFQNIIGEVVIICESELLEKCIEMHDVEYSLP